MRITYTYEQWLKIYKPIANHLTKGAPYDGIMFETYGAEHLFVRDQDPRLIWTLYDNGSIEAGYHFVNRLGYFVASVRRNLGEEQYATIDEPDEEDYCPECASEDIEKNSSGQIFCNNCGYDESAEEDEWEDETQW